MSSNWNPSQESKKLRVETAHGGENVEEISAPEPISDTSYHEHTWVLDPTETEFTAYMCNDNRCSAVLLYDKK